jgi:hypothetical protein
VVGPVGSLVVPTTILHNLAFSACVKLAVLVANDAAMSEGLRDGGHGR